VEMTENDWRTGFAKSLAVFLNGDTLPDPDPRGTRISDDSFLLLFNGHHGDGSFVLPRRAWGRRWMTEYNTASAAPAHKTYPAGGKVVVAARSVQVLRRL